MVAAVGLTPAGRNDISCFVSSEERAMTCSCGTDAEFIDATTYLRKFGSSSFSTAPATPCPPKREKAPAIAWSSEWRCCSGGTPASSASW